LPRLSVRGALIIRTLTRTLRLILSDMKLGMSGSAEKGS
jgi:hypothetical protein